MLLELLDQTPVTADMVRSWTRRDPILSKVTHFLHTGWPETTTAEMKPYKVRALELIISQVYVICDVRLEFHKWQGEYMTMYLALFAHCYSNILKIKILMTRL